MVAHLGCVAMLLSHNFSEQAKGCTTQGETRHKPSRPRALRRRKKFDLISFSSTDDVRCRLRRGRIFDSIYSLSRVRIRRRICRVGWLCAFRICMLSSSHCEKISRMSRLQNQIRLIVAYGMGAFFVAESLNPDSWRPQIASLGPIVHLFLGLFGLLWFVQAVAIHRQC